MAGRKPLHSVLTRPSPQSDDSCSLRSTPSLSSQTFQKTIGGADVIITATPAPVAQVQAVELARKGGRILLFGGLPKNDSKPGVDMNIVHYNAPHLIGTTIFGPRHYRLAVKLVTSGRIPVDKLITHRFPLADFKQGAAMALDGKVLKAVFFP